MTTLDNMSEISETEKLVVEKDLAQSEEQKRISVWVEYAKTHSPEETGQMLAQKEKEADTDSLTGIYNKRGWEKHVELFTNLAERKKEELSFCLIDIDDFKKVNDTWGHEFGDQALIFITQAVKKSLRQTDIFARVGGDEFGILLPEQGVDGAEKVRKRAAAELQRSLDEMDDDDGLKAAELSFSIGVSTKSFGESSANAIDRADQDMYKVKGIKKNV